jgi:dextran glucosidase, alpha amylase family, putative
VENEIKGPIFTFYQKLIALRKELPIIAEGSYQPAYEDSPQVYAFEREWQGQKLLVLNNFYADPITLDILPDYQNGQVLLSNYGKTQIDHVMTLQPYETLAILVGEN